MRVHVEDDGPVGIAPVSLDVVPAAVAVLGQGDGSLRLPAPQVGPLQGVMLDDGIGVPGGVGVERGRGVVGRIVLKSVEPQLAEIRPQGVDALQRIREMLPAVAGDRHDVDRSAGGNVHAGYDVLPERFSVLGIEWLNHQGVDH